MELTNKNPNIYTCCVSNENRLMELKTLSDELDKRQKSLSDYLDTKRNSFPRFYFLSDEDLLSILGNSEVHAV
jgi:dynein heavy chain